LPEGVVRALAKVAREKPAKVFASEEVCDAVERDRLPDSANMPPGISVVMEFTATSTSTGRVQFVLRDISRIKWLESTFSRYVSPNVIEELETHSQEKWLEMQRRDLSVLFCDLRGFTALTERIDPQTLQQMINSFLANMVAGVQSLGGMVEQFAGDGLMAIFGAPLPQEDHCLRAALSAMEMQERHGRWMAEQAQDGMPSLPLGVGFASGPVVVGNIGTRERLHYTALGHTTNLASRLCGIASPGEILTTADSWRRIEESWKQSPLPKLDVNVGSRGTRQLKNVADAVEIVAIGKC
jgi:class 3 adenylate cyclase